MVPPAATQSHVPHLPFLPTRLHTSPSRLTVLPSIVQYELSLLLQEAFCACPGVLWAFPQPGSHSSVTFNGSSHCRALTWTERWAYGDVGPLGRWGGVRQTTDTEHNGTPRIKYDKMRRERRLTAPRQAEGWGGVGWGVLRVSRTQCLLSCGEAHGGHRALCGELGLRPSVKGAIIEPAA